MGRSFFGVAQCTFSRMFFVIRPFRTERRRFREREERMNGIANRPHAGALRPRALGAAVGLYLLVTVAAGAAGAANPETVARPTLVSVKKIWDKAPHNAFTDLIRFRNAWFCTFREAEGHVKGDGKLRVITSSDGEKWQSAALLSEQGVDLRDPKLSITPDGRLMIVAGGSIYRKGRLVGRQPRVAFSNDGRKWSRLYRILSEGEWLWRVTWHKGRAYGVSYNTAGKENDWSVRLLVSNDGINYEKIADLDVPGRPNETTLRFADGDRMIALVRREGGNRHGWVGTSMPPYKEWAWYETNYRLGGPNFIILPDGSFWAASRHYAGGARTVLARFGPRTYEPVLTLPSGGDCSYPGLVWHDGLLWMSYYSSHEGKTSIYLARIRIGR